MTNNGDSQSSALALFQGVQGLGQLFRCASGGLAANGVALRVRDYWLAHPIAVPEPVRFSLGRLIGSGEFAKSVRVSPYQTL